MRWVASTGDLVGLYKRIAAQLDNPNTIPFPSESIGQSFTEGFIMYWLYKVFDSYILENGDLPSLLRDAQDKAMGMNACAAAVPAYKVGDPQNAYLKGIFACARKVDPLIASDPIYKSLFDTFGGN